jgi:hypothetical protein
VAGFITATIRRLLSDRRHQLCRIPRLGVREATAWLMKQKIMTAMQTREEAKPKLKGRIEMDDAYLGGARSGGKRGRGAAGKTPFIAAVETTIERRPRRIKLKTF